MTRSTNRGTSPGSRQPRTGFTLIELLVVMALIAFLSATVMLVAPGIMDKDRARDAATQLQGALQNARMRAMRDGLPRGVRLIVDSPPISVAPVPAGSPAIFVTASAYQYIEVPPWLLFTDTSGATPASGVLPPFLRFDYVLNVGTPLPQPTQPQNAIINRTCTIGGLTLAQMTQLSTIVNVPATTPTSALPTLGIPTLGVWTQIMPGLLMVNPTPKPPPNPLVFSCTIVLSVYPDAQLGGATTWMTPTGFTGPAYFGIYQVPRPLLGEPSIQLPLNTCVDLSDGVSQPSFATTGGIVGVSDYDVLFSPSGQLMNPSGVGQVFLCVRDPAKGLATPGLGNTSNGTQYCSMSPSASTLGGYPIAKYPIAYATGSTAGTPYNTALNKGGEQLLVSIKTNSGATGVSPIFWGTTLGQTPFDFARYAANSP